MKRHIKIVSVMMLSTILLASCSLFNKSDIKGFKKTKDGLHYKIEQVNKKGQEAHVGDVIVGEILFRLDNDTLYSNIGNPGRLMMIKDSVFRGNNIDEGLLMLHEGDKAVFAIFADSVAKYFNANQMPPSYKAKQNMIFYYEISVSDIVTHDELVEEQENFMKEMEGRKNAEPETIARYIADNNITAQPNSEGLYIIVNKMGKGAKVAAGKEVSMNYTGRLLDGKIFDSSIESDAKEGGVYDARRPYEPFTYTVGKTSLIKGWEDGIMGLPQGTQVTLVIPSDLAYGKYSPSEVILPYSPLRFDIEIISVK